jgi:hypothetical protein
MNVVDAAAAAAPGPGSYLAIDNSGDSDGEFGSSGSPTRGGGGRRGGKKVSAFFASQSQRLRADGQIAGPTRDAAQPGPGTYAIAEGAFDRVARTHVPEQFQFFGSKSARLGGGGGGGSGPLHANNSSAFATPGPGTYQIKSALRTGAEPGALLHGSPASAVSGSGQAGLSFASSSVRFAPAGAEEKEALPGPGAYLSQRNTALELSKKIFGRNTSFGTTESRFRVSAADTSLAGSAANSALAPGSYETNKSTLGSKGKKPLSVFVSATRRFDAASGRRADEQALALAAAQQGASSFNQSVPRGIGSEPTWGNGARNNPSAAFATLAPPRFGGAEQRALAKQRAQAAALGPGAYEINVSSINAGHGSNLYFQHGAAAASSATDGSAAFKTTQRSALAPGNVYARDVVPGPGSYARDVTRAPSSFLKRSFNITIATEV